MTYNDAQFSVFLSEELRGRAIAFLHERLAKLAPTIDPNWHSVSVTFPGSQQGKDVFMSRPSGDKDAYRLEFDYRPQVTLTGPKSGHVALEERIFETVPEPLMALLCLHSIFGYCCLEVRNSAHVVEILEGRTVIHFENCVSGVVHNVQGDTFDVEGFDQKSEGNDVLDHEQSHYTRERLLADFEIDECLGQASGVSYLPYLPIDGMPMDTLSAIREVRHRQLEEWRAAEAERDILRAAEEARRAEKEVAAYAALSDEERAVVDAERARVAAQDERRRALIGVIEGP